MLATLLIFLAERATAGPLATAEPVGTTETAPVANSSALTEAPVESAATKPKPTKRGSVFGNFFEKVRSPTHEKKESEVGPVVPPKDEPVSSEAPRLPEPSTEATELPAATEHSTAHITEPTAHETAAPVTESAVPTTETTAPKTLPAPKKEKESFLGGLLNKARAKSPAAEKRTASTNTSAPAVPPKNDEALETSKLDDSVAPVAPATTETAAPLAAETEPATENATRPTAATTPNQTRRKSYFGSLGGAKKDGETTESGTPLGKISNIFRRPSQAARGSKEARKENNVPEKISEPATTHTTEPTVASEAPLTEPEREQQSIGDVGADAVNLGQHQHSNPTVSASA